MRLSKSSPPRRLLPAVASTSNTPSPTLHQRNVERAAAQVVHQDLVRFILVQAVGQRRGGRLVDDAQHFQARDAAGILGRLALRVGEVSRHGDDRLGHGLAQIGLGVALQLLQNHGADLLGRIVFAVDVHPIVGAHLPLNGNHGAVRVGDRLALGHLADEALAVLGEGHHRGGGAAAFRVGDDGGLGALHHGHTGIGGAQIDTDNLAHNAYPPENSIVHIITVWFVLLMAIRRRLSPSRSG